LICFTPARRCAFAVPQKSLRQTAEILEVPNLIKVQLDSFGGSRRRTPPAFRRDFADQGLHPATASRSASRATSFREPRYSELECRQRDLTYSAPLYVKTRLLVRPRVKSKSRTCFPATSAHDDQGHFHHRRRRTRGRQPAAALLRSLSGRRRGRGHRSQPSAGQADTEPRGHGSSSRRAVRTLSL